MNRPHGLDELAGVTAASTVPLILLPVPTVRDLAAYALDLERRVALVERVRGLASVESTPATPDPSEWSRVRDGWHIEQALTGSDAWRGRGG